MSEHQRVIDHDWAVHEIADAIRDRQHWIIGTTPQTLERVADAIPTRWNPTVYLDNGTGIILVGTGTTALATAALMPHIAILGGTCAIFILAKTTPARELNKVFRSLGQKIPADGSQDIVLFAEELDDEHQVGYMPTLLMDAADQVDGKR